MQYRPLGRTGEKVSCLDLGGSHIGGSDLSTGICPQPSRIGSHHGHRQPANAGSGSSDREDLQASAGAGDRRDPEQDGESRLAGRVRIV
jgi:aryl-alcohol dehydrogenase-like predicted oxidoreductase